MSSLFEGDERDVWQRISCVRWNAMEEREEDARRKNAEIEEQSSATSRMMAAERAGLARIYEERKVRALDEIMRHFQSADNEVARAALRNMMGRGSLAVVAMSVWRAAADQTLYADYCRSLLAVDIASSSAGAPEDRCVRLLSASHVRVMRDEYVDEAWMIERSTPVPPPGRTPSPMLRARSPGVGLMKQSISLDTLCCSDDSDAGSRPASPAPGFSQRAYDDDSDDEFLPELLEMHFERVRSYTCTEIAELLGTAENLAELLHSGGVCAQITHLSVCARWHSADGYQYGMVAVLERGSLAHSNVADGCWRSADAQWKSTGRSVQLYVMREDCARFACATLDLCCGAVRISSAREVRLALPFSPERRESSACDECWRRLWKDSLGTLIFPGAQEGVRASFSRRSTLEMSPGSTFGAQDNVLMKLVSASGAEDAPSRHVYLQSAEAPYFYATPALADELFDEEEDGREDGRPLSYVRGSDPRTLMRILAASAASSAIGESECPDHAPTFAGRMQIMQNKDAAKYAGMRSLRGLGVPWRAIVDSPNGRWEGDGWVRQWAETCERASFCVCGMRAPPPPHESRRSEPLSSSSSGSLWAPETESRRRMLVWGALLDSSSLPLFDSSERLGADIDSSRYSAHAMARLRAHSSRVVITVDVEVDRRSDAARASESGYRILLDAVPWGALNMREGTVYRLRCSEAKLRDNLGFWVESRAVAYRRDELRVVNVGDGERGVRVVRSEEDSRHLDVTVTRRDSVLEREDERLCFGLADQYTKFGEVSLMPAGYSGETVSASRRSAAQIIRRRQASSSSAAAEPEPPALLSMSSSSEEDVDDFYSEDERDVLAERRSKMVHVGIVFLYTPLSAGRKLSAKAYSKRMPLTSARVRDKEWFFSPLAADPTLDECAQKVTAAGGKRPSTSVLKLSSDAYYRLAVVLDPECDSPFEEVHCPELRVCKDGAQLATLPALSKADDVLWSEMLVASAGDEDDEGTLPLPVSIRTGAADGNCVVFRIVHS